MLCTFTLAPRNDDQVDPLTLVIRSEDIKCIRDKGLGVAELAYQIGIDIHYEHVAGTARENMERLQVEELDAVGRVNAHQQAAQQRMSQGLPVIPVPRGRQPR